MDYTALIKRPVKGMKPLFIGPLCMNIFSFEQLPRHHYIRTMLDFTENCTITPLSSFDVYIIV